MSSSLSPLRVHVVGWDASQVAAERIRWEQWWRSVMKERSGNQRWILAKVKAFEVRDLFQDGDLQIHVGMPVYGAVPWSYINWLFLPSGTRIEEAWRGILPRWDAVVVETEEEAEVFRARGWIDTVKTLASLGQNDVEEVAELLRARKPTRGVRHLPPVLEKKDCPPLSIITPTFQRKKLMEIAFHNLLMTDYPLEKVEWVVVEDNDRSPHGMKRPLEEFQAKVPSLRIRYIPLEGRRSIGEKRNVGITAASHEWILFMDDDDHYPATSFRRRMAWLLRGTTPGQAVYRISACTTIALYDLQRGVSAVNVPPPTLPLSQRVSEATLGFHRSVWEERPFPDVSVSEAEGWLQGRETEVIEIPPQQIIVAFTHGGNQSSRRLPPTDQPPSCFWGFPREYLVFIHGLVGVDLV